MSRLWTILEGYRGCCVFLLVDYGDMKEGMGIRYGKGRVFFEGVCVAKKGLASLLFGKPSLWVYLMVFSRVCNL
jgi:hypothetical protein